MSRITAISLAFALALTSAASEAAAGGSGSALPHGRPDRNPQDSYGPLAQAVEGMQRSGQGQAAIDAMLASQFGWVRVSDEEPQLVLLASENSDVELTKPTIYYNTQRGRYEASAWFFWRNCGGERCWKQDLPWIGTSIGGYDGFGLSMSTLVNRKAQSFYVFTETGVMTSYPNPWDAEDSGATFRNQDKIAGPGQQYNWDHGLLVYSFQLRLGCPKGNYKAKTKLGHTWSSAGVSNIQVTTSGVSISFTSSDGYWQATNPTPGNDWYPCGR